MRDEFPGGDARLSAALDAMRQMPPTSADAVARVAARAVLANAPAARVTRWGYRAAAALVLLGVGALTITGRGSPSLPDMPAVASADPTERTVITAAPVPVRSVLAAASRPIVFELDAAKARSVQVLGDFNGWSLDADRMQRGADGRWRITTVLPPGRYVYAFLIDGHRFQPDPSRDAVEDRDFGVTGSELVVSAAP